MKNTTADRSLATAIAAVAAAGGLNANTLPAVIAAVDPNTTMWLLSDSMRRMRSRAKHRIAA